MKMLHMGLMLAAIGAFAAPALAQSVSSANEDAGATTGLGSSHRFASAEAAAKHCPGDMVVWAPAHGLHYLMPGAPGYAHAGSGFYACKMEADDAGFSPKG
jgi:hypothetical protein